MTFLTLYKKELFFEKMTFLYWSVGLSLMIFFSMMAYPIMKSSAQDLSIFMEAMPKSLLALFGMHGLDLSSAQGFYGIIYFYGLLGATLYGATLGVRLLGKEESLKTTEFLFTKPKKRGHILREKLLAGLTLLMAFGIVLHVASYLSFFVFAKEELLHGVLLKETLSLFFLSLFFFSLGFFASSLFHKAKQASGLTLSMTLGTFLLGIFYDLLGEPVFLSYLTPYRYFPVQELTEGGGLSLPHLMLLMVFTAFFFASSSKVYGARDLRVS